MAGEDDDDHARLAALSLYRACRELTGGLRYLDRGATDSLAAYELGRLFEEGIGVPKCRDGALLLWTLAKVSPEGIRAFQCCPDHGRSASAHLSNNDTWNSASSQSRSRAQSQLKVIEDALCDVEIGPGAIEDAPPSVLAFDDYTGGAGSLVFHIHADYAQQYGPGQVFTHELDGWSP